MRLIIFLILSFVFNSYAQVSIEVIPKNPSVNEVFQILFKANVEGREEPEINFNARNFEVLDKQSQGLSTRTIYQAGKITVSKEVLISYTAVAKKVGMATIANTRVRIGSKYINKDDVKFQISDKPAGPRLVFVAAEVSRDEVYINEGITLRYYLYRRVGVQSTDIKKYPKLDMFMKRYLQENENPQRVTVNGEIFTRSTLYSARLFPEEAGDFVIDPIEMMVSYSKENLGSFGFGFGMSGRDLVTTTISSDPIKIKVKQLPELSKPKDFSGLVGQHRFDLVMGRPNILVNEPLEVKVSIQGPGKLEGFTPIEIFKSPSLEQFDVKADLALVGADSAIKTFTYTFLGKSNGVIPPSTIKISYFNPETKAYEYWSHDLPEIRIAGGEAVALPPPVLNQPQSKPSNTIESGTIVLVERDKVSLGVLLLSFLLALGFGAYKISKSFTYIKLGKNSEISKAISALRSGSYSHRDLAILFEAQKGDSKGGIKECIASSGIDSSLITYFQQILDGLDLNIKDGSATKLQKVSKKAINTVLQQKRNSNETT